MQSSKILVADVEPNLHKSSSPVEVKMQVLDLSELGKGLV